MVMDAAVSVKDVMNPRMMFVVSVGLEASAAPTITAKPIIRQFSGLIRRRSPVIFSIWFSSQPFLSQSCIRVCCAVECSYGYGAFRFYLWFGCSKV